MDFTFTPCGPDCECAQFELPVENDLVGDLVEDAADSAAATAEALLREAYNRGYSDGAREALDNFQATSGLLDGEAVEDPQTELLLSVDEDLAELEEDFGLLAEELGTALASIFEVLYEQKTLNELLATVLELHKNRLETVEENQTIDTAYLESNGLLVQDIARRVDAVERVLGLADPDGQSLGEGVYLL